MTNRSTSSARSPLAGCLIFVLAFLMLVFLIGFAIWVPFRQAEEIAKFTQKEPVSLPVENLEQNEPSIKELIDRLEKFRQDLVAEPPREAHLRLKAGDLNQIIAFSPALAELKGTFRVTAIEDGKIHADICYRLNGVPRLTRDGEEGTFTSDPMYLVAKIRFRPELQRRELALKLDSVEVPGKTVPPEFVNHLSTLRIFEKSKQDPVLGPAMAALTRAGVEGNEVFLARVPGESPPETVSDEDFRRGGGRLVKWLGLGACVFLVFAGLMIFYGLRRQTRLLAENSSKNQANSGEGDV